MQVDVNEGFLAHLGDDVENLKPTRLNILLHPLSASRGTHTVCEDRETWLRVWWGQCDPFPQFGSIGSLPYMWPFQHAFCPILRTDFLVWIEEKLRISRALYVAATLRPHTVLPMLPCRAGPSECEGVSITPAACQAVC